MSNIRLDKKPIPQNGCYEFQVMERYYNCGANGKDVNITYNYPVAAENVEFQKDNDEYIMHVKNGAFDNLITELNNKEPDDCQIYPRLCFA